MQMELREAKAKQYKCPKCGKVYASVMRVQHHIAAEHAPRTMKDIRTTKDIHITKDIPHSTGSQLS